MLVDTAVARLQRGEYQAAITTLEILRFHDPANTAVLYNLGMALSDQGQLPAAIAHLRRAGQLDPTDANTQIALGVALARDGKLEEAIVCLQNGVLLDPANPWAYRNLGGCQARLGRNTEAEANLRRAAELNPDDPAAHVGLGKVLLELKRSDEADEHFLRVIELDPFGAIGESAKESRTRIAEANFRSTGIGGLRPDAVMYLAGALELFASMTPKQVQSVGMEIAVLGLKGLDTNDPAQKYRLKCLPGPFSGLNLMCLMYVAFKQIAPDQDIGFDVTREYRAALEFVEARKATGGE